ncbi:anthrone oxygenase family protein [Plantactinospora soyae]|uniref:Membrane protein n=1 Tax=Plantactinospora soyae TaxID=1544732 RepID=A0A927MC12_9ACTN|nr:anthrone oxygenase family protein [Plantactinospora soyae]MBE1491709.1 putative membrane protein [Plantactinospora soyae]
MSSPLRSLVLTGATLSTGLMAGLFAAFSYSIMPGLGSTDDRTFVSAMQRINEAILNGWFFTCFFGALVLTAVAVLLHLRRPATPWLVAALVLYAAVLVITIAVNVPLNDKLAAAGNVEHIADLAAVRQRFEATWVGWNLVRAVVSTAAFGCLTWALLLTGRLPA